MSDRCDINLRQVKGKKPNPRGLLRRIVGGIESLLKTGSPAFKKWARAKATKESVQVKEIQARILQDERKLNLQRETLLQEYELEQQRINNAHEEKKLELELKRQRERREAIKDAVQVIKDLKEIGVDVDLRVIKKNPAKLFELIAESDTVGKKILESDAEDAVVE